MVFESSYEEIDGDAEGALAPQAGADNLTAHGEE